jgi:hypothetical protein
MLRMIPVKVDYLSDQVEAFPLHVYAHRNWGLFQIKVTTGDVVPSSWRKK